MLIGGFSSLISCASILTNDIYSFKNIPKPGDTIVQQPSLVYCLNDAQALAMSASGLFVSGCHRVTAPDSYTVTAARFAKLSEGGVWLITATGPAGAVIIPFPWHNWV